MIHETAMIHASADIADDVSIGPYSVIGENVTIGKGTRIGPHVVISRFTRIGEQNTFYQFASVGENPQDKKYNNEETWLEMGDNNVVRENVTINRGTLQDGGVTRIGSDNLIMAGAHVAHDCIIGDHAILANAASLGGHVKIGDWAILGGFTIVHQFCQIGEHCFTQMGSMISKDVPPYLLVGGHPAKPRSINKEGLKRRGFTPEQIRAMITAYKILYMSDLKLDAALQKLDEVIKENEVVRIMKTFILDSHRSIVR